MSDLEDLLVYQIKAVGLPAPEREVRFAGVDGTRRWRFDLGWPDRKVAAEVDGGTYVAGRHTRGAAIESDAAKFSEASVCGWRLLRFTARMVASGRAVDLLERILGVTR